MTSRLLRRICSLIVLVLAAALLPTFGLASAAPGPSSPEEPSLRSLFTKVSDFALPRGDAARVRPAEYTAYELDLDKIRASLAEAPSSAAVARGTQPLTLVIPDPRGRPVSFAVVEDSVMEPGLAAKFPGIRTYAGRGVDDPTRSIRLDFTPMGFHASVKSPGGTRGWYIDPAVNERGTTTHLSYAGASLPAPEEAFEEKFLDGAEAGEAEADLDALAAAAPGQDVVRRTYRLAFVTDPTYAQYFGTENVMAEKVTLMNRVNQIYNDDLAIHMVLIDGTEKLNFDTAEKATQPNGPCGANACYTPAQLSGCSGGLLNRNTFVIGQVLGADEYDIGHIGLGLNGGGVAGLGVVGESGKARGCTGLPKPEGDFFAVDYVAHEMGHQFAGNHTFNGNQANCSLTNRNADTSVEPGSGSSVMAYAGICAQDNLQPHSDPYFSQRSIDEITAHVTAEPFSYDEQQTITLRGFDTDGERIRLTYRDEEPVALERGSSAPTGRTFPYNTVGVGAAIKELTGFVPDLSGYDGGTAPGNDGFRAFFDVPAQGSDVNLARIGVVGASEGVTGFTGVQVQGGPGTNQGMAKQVGNIAPEVTAPADKTLPIRTPFTLVGSGRDADGDPLTYLWEQNDVGTSQVEGTALVNNTKTDGPLFRIFGVAANVSDEDALESPSPGLNLADGRPRRTFPDLAQIVAGNTNAKTGACPAAPADAAADVPQEVVDCFSEFLPTADYGDPVAAGELNFRLTARDIFATGGGTAHDDVTLTLDRSAGPFLVTSRETAGEPALAGTKETVTWDVANTDRAALAPMVRILLSTDGGRTFPGVLATSTPNDGTEAVALPQVSTKQARIRIEAVGNYFFDVSDADFAIASVNTRITDGPANRSFLLTPSTTMQFTSTESGSTFMCALDGRAVPCGNGSVRLENLSSGTHRFTVAARSPAGAVDPTPAVRRFASPFTARQVKQATGGWQLKRDSAAYRGTFLQTRRSGAVLTKRADRMTRIALVVGTGPGFGRIAVSVGGKRVGIVSTQSARTQDRVLIPVERFRKPRSGVVRLETLDRRTVRLEGVGIYTR